MRKNKTSTRYILIDENLGVFLGLFSLQDFIPPNMILEGETNMMESYSKAYAVFAAHNPFKLCRAESFASKEEAKEYIRKSFREYSDLSLMAAPVKTAKQNVNLEDLIRSGYIDYTYDMLDGLEAYSDTVH